MATPIGELNVAITADESKFIAAVNSASAGVKTLSSNISNSMTGIAASMQSGIINPADAAKRSLAALNQAFNAEMKVIKETGTVTDEQAKKMAALRKEIDQLGESLKKTKTPWNPFAGLVQQAATIGTVFSAISLVSRGIEFNKMAESAQISFEVIIGNATKAQQLFNDLKTFAFTTPLQFQDVQQVSKTLLQFGINTKEIIPIVKSLGDISGGDAEKFKSLGLAFAQSAAAGHLMGQDLNQMIQAGFNPLKEMAEHAGASYDSFRKKMEAGEITTAMVTESFKRVTAEGGQFFGMMDRQSKTLAGALSNTGDAFDQFLGSITKSLTGPLKGLLNMATMLLNGFVALPEPIQAVAGTFVVLAAAIAAATIAAKTFGITLSASFGPVGLIIAGIVALAVGISTLNKSSEENLAINKKLIDSQKANILAARDTLGPVTEMNKNQLVSAEQLKKLNDIYPGFNKNLKDEAATYDAVAKAIQNVSAERAKESIKKVEEQIRGAALGQQLDATTLSMYIAQKRNQAEIDAVQKRIGDRQKASVELQKQLVDLTKVSLGIVDKAKDDKAIDTTNQKLVDAENKYQLEVAAMRTKAENDEEERLGKEYIEYQTFLMKKKEAEQKAVDDGFKATASSLSANLKDVGGLVGSVLNGIGDRFKNTFEDIASIVKETFSIITSAVKASFDAQSKMLDQQMMEEEDAAGVKAKTATQSAQDAVDTAQATYDAETDMSKKADELKTLNDAKATLTRSQIEEKYQQKQVELQYQAAHAAWEIQVVQTLGLGAMAVAQALANVPPPYSYIAAGLAGAAVVAQEVILAQNEPQMPKFWSSGTVPGTQYAGDKVPIRVNSGENIISASDSQNLMQFIKGGMNSGGGNQTIQIAPAPIYLDGQMVGEVVFKQMLDGRVRIPT